MAWRCSPTSSTAASLSEQRDGRTAALDRVAGGRTECRPTAEVLGEIMAGGVAEAQIAGFLMALRTKGETVEE